MEVRLARYSIKTSGPIIMGKTLTPFAIKLRELREQHGINQKQLAAELDVSAAYLSALEHGQRGNPSWNLVQKIITRFNIIWDEAEELQSAARNSDPKIQVDTRNLSAQATALANLFAAEIGQMSAEEIKYWHLRLRKNQLKNNR